MTKPTWEEEFDKEFPALKDFSNNKVTSTYIGDVHKIKSFISKLIEEAKEEVHQSYNGDAAKWQNVGVIAERQRILKIIEGMKKQIRDKEGNVDQMSDTGNVVYFYLSDLTTAITSNEKKV